MSTTVTRREFLTGTAAACAAPWFVPASALGNDGELAPSNRITLAAIGLGGRNTGNLSHFLLQPEVRCLAVCDCFADRRQNAKATVDRHYGNQDCRATRFHEEVFARPDIDAVLIGTGDRWHGVLSMLAAKAGKDVYCEKPFCLTIGEGRSLVAVTRRYGTVWQCGTQRRSNSTYRFVVDVVRKGMIGKLRSITTLLGTWGGNGVAKPEREPDPDVFDYDRWLGQAPWAPYSAVRVALWRNQWDLAGGVIADMGAHYFDFAQWAHDSELSGPIEYEGTGAWPDGGIADVPFDVNVQARYADGVRLIVKCGDKGVRFVGDAGWIHCSDGGDITAEPKSILQERGAPRVDWAFMGDHVRNFLDCVKSRSLTASHPELAHRAHTMIHCANLCLRLRRKVRWDPNEERFVGDDDANRMLTRAMRPPWTA
jgi:predicted dehydrogenase